MFLSGEKKVETKLMMCPQIDIIIELKLRNISMKLFSYKKILTLPTGEILYS